MATRVALIDTLLAGLTHEDRRGTLILYRLLQATDDDLEITDLLHRAYAPHAAAGLHYVASHQSPEVTRQRMAKGDTIVAVLESRIIGIVTLSAASATRGTPFYDRGEVAKFGQFAVEPSRQRNGIGSRLLALVEELARAHGIRELGLDTSEHAADLIQFYESKGYRFVEFTRWPSVNYRSLIMAKWLETSTGAS